MAQSGAAAGLDRRLSPSSPCRDLLPVRTAGQSHMPYGATFGGAVPPPLTPPHKGEGDFAAAMPRKIANDWCAAGLQAGPLPLWGGVRGGGTAPPNVICDCPGKDGEKGRHGCGFANLRPSRMDETKRPAALPVVHAERYPAGQRGAAPALDRCCRSTSLPHRKNSSCLNRMDGVGFRPVLAQHG